MISDLNKQLLHIRDLLKFLPDNAYSKPVLCFNNQSIGAHVRHIIELVDCLVHQYDTGIINYNDRARDKKIENNRDFAIASIDHMLPQIDKEDKKLRVVFTSYENKRTFNYSSYFREVQYNIEHCTHHEALIKIALCELNLADAVCDSFGVATSTLLAHKTKS
jgi:hypothetical protein